MASGGEGLFLSGVKAAADLSAAQYKFVKLDASGDIALITSFLDKPCGVLQNKPDGSGVSAKVMFFGHTKINADAALNEGEGIAPAADGQAARMDLGSVGQMVTAVAVAAEIGSALINCAAPQSDGAGGAEILITTKALERWDSGKTFSLELAGGFTVTLPTVAQAGAGWNCRFMVGIVPTTAYIITEDTGTDTDKLMGGINELEVDTGQDGPYGTAFTLITLVASAKTSLGDYVDIFCDGTFFQVRGQAKLDDGMTLT